MPTAPPTRTTLISLALLVCSVVFLVLALSTGCTAARAASKVLAGAQTVLEGICDHVPSAHLEMAQQLLERGDLPGAVHYLRAELVENGHQRDVSALLALVESQMPERE